MGHLKAKNLFECAFFKKQFNKNIALAKVQKNPPKLVGRLSSEYEIKCYITNSKIKVRSMEHNTQ
jgi:hypothetical protein